MNGATPPDPNRFTEDCSVDESNQCSYAHFVRDDCVRSKAQALPQITRIEVKILLFERLAFFASEKRILPTPGVTVMAPGGMAWTSRHEARLRSVPPWRIRRSNDTA